MYDQYKNIKLYNLTWSCSFNTLVCITLLHTFCIIFLAGAKLCRNYAKTFSIERTVVVMILFVPCQQFHHSSNQKVFWEQNDLQTIIIAHSKHEEPLIMMHTSNLPIWFAQQTTHHYAFYLPTIQAISFGSTSKQHLRWSKIPFVPSFPNLKWAICRKISSWMLLYRFIPPGILWNRIEPSYFCLLLP